MQSPEANNNLDLKKLLFSPDLLEKIAWDEHGGVYSPEISPRSPGHGLHLRPLSLHDYDRGYLDLLAQLTNVGHVSRESFERRFLEMKACAGTYFTLVIEDVARDTIVGSGSLVLEQKFIHSAGTRARIEDLVVSNECRGRQLGKLLMDTLTLLAKSLGAYKVSLECVEKLVRFYGTFGFECDGNQYMVQRFKP